MSEGFRAYWGLIEAMMTLGGVSLFVWWQMRSLKRDIAAREARERAAAEATKAGSGEPPRQA
ncbi:MAG: hypothetical protein MUC58_11020 [Rhizobiaceae bacterium]|jgi:hypothetical protein|nr:hypothetical protein [Rhizobiaceae bacterium]